MQDQDVRCIGIDWGTSRFRAYGLSGSGAILKRHVSDAGVANVAGQAFESVFVRELGSWLEAHPAANVLASGMAGSRLGWVETRYLPCPVDLSRIASALERRSIGGRTIAFTPGLTRVARDGMPDVMRGEEIQVLGSLAQLGDGWYVLPGTHSKWVLLAAGQIVWFASFMSGELFDVLVQHTVLTQAGSAGALAESSALDAFSRGLDYARGGDAESGGFLKRLFSTRSLVARGELSRPEAREYLSGLIIGGELREALASLPGGPPARVMLIGAPELSRRYASAFERAGIVVVDGPPDAAASGHFAIARQAGLV
ncbi:MAG: 2-dehydro-3-deoxygalactonokinase [Deltaproteobacteria bacterium]